MIGRIGQHARHLNRNGSGGGGRLRPGLTAIRRIRAKADGHRAGSRNGRRVQRHLWVAGRDHRPGRLRIAALKFPLQVRRVEREAAVLADHKCIAAGHRRLRRHAAHLNRCFCHQRLCRIAAHRGNNALLRRRAVHHIHGVNKVGLVCRNTRRALHVVTADRELRYGRYSRCAERKCDQKQRKSVKALVSVKQAGHHGSPWPWPNFKVHVQKLAYISHICSGDARFINSQQPSPRLAICGAPVEAVQAQPFPAR